MRRRIRKLASHFILSLAALFAGGSAIASPAASLDVEVSKFRQHATEELRATYGELDWKTAEIRYQDFIVPSRNGLLLDYSALYYLVKLPRSVIPNQKIQHYAFFAIRLNGTQNNGVAFLSPVRRKDGTWGEWVDEFNTRAVYFEMPASVPELEIDSRIAAIRNEFPGSQVEPLENRVCLFQCPGDKKSETLRFLDWSQNHPELVVKESLEFAPLRGMPDKFRSDATRISDIDPRINLAQLQDPAVQTLRAKYRFTAPPALPAPFGEGPRP